MLKNLLLFLMCTAIFIGCTTSLKDVNIKNISVLFLQEDSKRGVTSVVPGSLYNIAVNVNTVEGDLIDNPDMKAFNFRSPNDTLIILNKRSVRVRPQSFVFTDGRLCQLHVEIPSAGYSELFSWPVDWDEYNTLDFTPKPASHFSSSDVAALAGCCGAGCGLGAALFGGADSDKERKPDHGTHGSHGDHGEDGKNLEFDAAYYSVETETGSRNYILFFERNTNALYALPTDKRIAIIADGGQGEDGDDGTSGKYGGDGGDGGDGGNIIINYRSGSDVLRFLKLSVEGGRPGRGGTGGSGSDGGRDGQDGNSGRAGRDGQTTIAERNDFSGMFEAEGYPNFDRALLKVNK
jgi:hypothetical protein